MLKRQLKLFSQPCVTFDNNIVSFMKENCLENVFRFEIHAIRDLYNNLPILLFIQFAFFYCYSSLENFFSLYFLFCFSCIKYPYLVEILYQHNCNSAIEQNTCLRIVEICSFDFFPFRNESGLIVTCTSIQIKMNSI